MKFKKQATTVLGKDFHYAVITQSDDLILLVTYTREQNILSSPPHHQPLYEVTRQAFGWYRTESQDVQGVVSCFMKPTGSCLGTK